jgi:hypothetical protein
MHALPHYELRPISAIPEAVLTALELQFQRALVADLMYRLATLEKRLKHTELRQDRTDIAPSNMHR